MSGHFLGIDLRAQERLGGHTIARHVRKDAAWLGARLVADAHIPMASSFTDLPTAEYHVAAAVQANLPALLLWLGDSSRAVQRFDYDADTCFVLTAFPIL